MMEDKMKVYLLLFIGTLMVYGCCIYRHRKKAWKSTMEKHIDNFILLIGTLLLTAMAVCIINELF